MSVVKNTLSWIRKNQSSPPELDNNDLLYLVDYSKGSSQNIYDNPGVSKAVTIGELSEYLSTKISGGILDTPSFNWDDMDKKEDDPVTKISTFTYLITGAKSILCIYETGDDGVQQIYPSEINRIIKEGKITDCEIVFEISDDKVEYFKTLSWVATYKA